MIVVNKQISIPARELDFSFARSPGPGGQNVNKLNTKVILKWDVTRSDSIPEAVRIRFLAKFKRRISKTGQIVLTSHRYRDQGRNVADAIHKLRELVLAVATPPRVRRKTKPSRSSVRRRLDNKRKNSQRKQSRRPPGSND